MGEDNENFFMRRVEFRKGVERYIYHYKYTHGVVLFFTLNNLSGRGWSYMYQSWCGSNCACTGCANQPLSTLKEIKKDFKLDIMKQIDALENNVINLKK